MFGNKGIFGEDLSVGRAQNAEFDALRKGRALAESRNNAEEWKDYAIQADKTLDETRQTYVVNGVANQAGLRSVIRELLVELKKSDPKNPLLVKKTRDAIFDVSRVEQRNRQGGISYRTLHDNLENFRDLVYGAKDADASGPELADLTSNLQVRAAAGVPAHTPEIRQYETLITQLGNELAKFSPQAGVLTHPLLAQVLADIKAGKIGAI